MVSLVAFSAISRAQMPSSPKTERQPSPQEMEAMVAQMSAGMVKMMENIFDTTFNYLAKKETSTKLATFTKNYYDELIKQGFTKKEAMHIVTSVGMPNMSMIK